MPKPVGYVPDPNGGFRVQFADGSSTLMATDPGQHGIAPSADAPPPMLARPAEEAPPPAAPLTIKQKLDGMKFDPSLEHRGGATTAPQGPEDDGSAAPGELVTAGGGGGGTPVQVQAPQPQRTVVIPGGWTPASATVRPGAALDPALLSEREDLNVLRKANLAGGAEVATAKAEQEATAWREHADALQAEQARHDASQAGIRSDIDKRMRAFDQASKEAANATVDPNHYMAEKGTFGRIIAAIAVGLGAAGASGSGGRNYALDIIQGSIDKDIDAQKAKIAGKTASVGHAKTSLDLAQQLGADENQWTIARRAQLLELAKSRVQRIAADASGEEAKRNALALGYDLDAQILAERERFQLLTRDQVVEQRMAYAPTRVVGVGGGGSQQIKSDYDHEMHVPGMGAALSKEDAKTIKPKVASIDDLTESLKDLDKTTETMGDRASPALRARADSLRGEVLMKLKEAYQMGALDKGAKEVGDQIMGDPMALVRPGGNAVLKDMQARLARSKAIMARDYGVTPGVIAVVTDPATGRRVRVTQYTGEQAAPTEQPRTLQARGAK